MSKIPTFAPIVEAKVRCKICNHPHHHRHGWYFRKATHRRPKRIQVLRCRCLSCRSTFSVLPQELLPVMRWTLKAVRHASRLLMLVSAYRAAKLLRVTLGVMLRLARKLPKLGATILLLGKSRGFGDAKDPLRVHADIFEIPYLWPCWISFIRELSLVMYPLLHMDPQIPHDM